MSEHHELVGLEKRDGVALVTLDRPDKLNALSKELLEQLVETLVEIEDDDEIGAVILTGSPKARRAAFAAGADIAEMAEMGPLELRAHAHLGQTACSLLEGMPKPVMAAVNGVALGGGCEIAMACDVRIAGFSASFGQPEISLGIIPGFGGTQRLPRLVGPAKALEMNTTGEPISASEAFEYGLVNSVVPDHELFDAALNRGRKFARQAPVALEQIKRVSHAGDLAEGIEAEKGGFIEAFISEDAREGISAFLGKRTPEFRGK